MSPDIVEVDKARDARDVRRAQAGDRAALDALLRRHYDRIRALCRRIVGNDADADDATQEALILIARGIGRFDGRSAFGTWAYRVTTNACLDELRRRGRRPQPAEIDDERSEASGRALDQSVAGRLDIDAALAQLPTEFRIAVVLRDLCQLDYREIADTLGVPAGTVRSRIARGRAHLARLLEPDHGNQAPAPQRQNEQL